MSEKVSIPVAFDAAKTLPKKPISHKAQSALTIFFLTLSAAETLVFWLIVRPTFNDLKQDFGVFVSALIFVIVVVGMKLGMRYGPNLSSNTNNDHISGQVFVRLVMVPITVVMSVFFFHGVTFIAYQMDSQHRSLHPRLVQIVDQLNTWLFVVPQATPENNIAIASVGNPIKDNPPSGGGFIPLVIVGDSHKPIKDNPPSGNGFIPTHEEDVLIYIPMVDMPPSGNVYPSQTNHDEQVQIAIDMGTTIDNQSVQMPSAKQEQVALTSFNPDVEENGEASTIETDNGGLLDMIVENPISVVDDLVHPPAVDTSDEALSETQPDTKYEQPDKTPDGSETSPNNGNPGQGNDKPVGNAGENPPGQAGN